MKEIRGKGLMMGIELDRPCGELVQQAWSAGLLINVTADTVVRLLPPLILRPAEAQPARRRRRGPDPKNSWREPARLSAITELAQLLMPAVKHFLQLTDFSRAEFDYLLERTPGLKRAIAAASSISRCAARRWA